jgi:hypothetical protein
MNFEDRLRNRFATASEQVPGRPLDWAETYSRARRSRTIYRAALAFGTAVVVAAGGFGAWTVLEGRGDAPRPQPPASTETPEPEVSPTPSEEPTPEQDVSFEEPFRAVENFIQGAAEGDVQAMWAEMTDISKAIFGGDIERFRNYPELSGIQEGWGSWAAAKGFDMHWRVIGSSGEETLGVVTLMGSRRPEGHKEPFASAAIPVRVDSDGVAKLELFVSNGIFELITPRDMRAEQPPALASVPARNPSFEVLVPGAPTDVHMVLAPVPREPPVSIYSKADVEEGDGDNVRALWTPEENLFSGEWFLTVVAVYGDGSMQADSVRFTIE